MEGLDVITNLTELGGNLTVTAILLYLLITERRSHEETRKIYRVDMLRVIGEVQKLLEEIAGIKANVWNVQRFARDSEATRRDTRPLPPPDE